MSAIEALSFTKGSNWSITVDCNKANKVTPVDLSGSASVKIYLKDASLTVVSTIAASITDAANGIAVFDIAPNQQSAIVAGTYTYVIRATDSAGRITDQVSGTLVVLADPSVNG